MLKVEAVQKCGMEEVVGQAKGISTNHSEDWSWRWWCVYGRIRREDSVMSSFKKTKCLIPTSTAPN